MTSEVQWQNYLNEATDAIFMGDSVDAIRSHYGISNGDDNDLIDLIDNLDKSFPTVEPSTQFSARLKGELTGVEQAGVVWTIRRLPARVQWAAVVTAILGGALIVLQRLIATGNRLRREEPARIPDES